ncbi:MAG: helix-turn-helix domain-containing protein [Patescibacteria group bacterium]
MLTLEKAAEMVTDAKERSESNNEVAITVVSSTPDDTKNQIPEGSSVPDISDPEGNLHSLTEVARFLKISENRVRHWEKTFNEVLSNHRNQYNHRIFTDADVKVLERIKFLQDSKLYTKEGIVARLNSKIRDKGTGAVTATEKQFQQKLLIALNTLASEVKGLRREVREDLKGDLKKELDHLTLLLFPPKQEKKWYQFFKK